MFRNTSKYAAIVAILVAPSIAGASEQPAGYKDGFAHLINDPSILSSDDFKDVKSLPGSVALYYDGDRLHRKVPKEVAQFVEDQLTVKMVNEGLMRVADCPDCKKTKVVVLKDAMRVETPASSKKGFEELGQRVGAESFLMWDANETEGRFNLATRLVDAQKGEILWSKEYIKNITQRDVELGYSQIDWRLSLSTWGLTATREATEGGKAATLSGVTAITIDRKMMPHNNNGIGYSVGFSYFKNTSGNTLFDVSGYALKARVIADMGRLFDRIPYIVYAGLGNVQFNESRGFMLDAGVEFPFSKHGFASFGAVQLSGDQIQWDYEPGYLSSSEFGGVAYDFTVGFNF